MATYDKYGFARSKEKSDLVALEERVRALEESQGEGSAKTLFPVGYIFITVSSSVDPNALFTGTTWVRLPAGKMLVNFDASDNALNKPMKTGGNKTHAHTIGNTTLAAKHLPWHVHRIGQHRHNIIYDVYSGNGMTPAQLAGVKRDARIFTEYNEALVGDEWRVTLRPDDGNDFGKLNLMKLNDGSKWIITGDPVDGSKTVEGTGGGTEGTSTVQGHTHSCANSSSMPPYVVCYMWRRTA